MQGRQLAIGLILCFLAVCHPKVAEAQFFYQQPYNTFVRAPRQGPGQRQGSFSGVRNNAYQREIDYGNVELTNGVSNSRAITKNNGGFRNGGTTSITDTNAFSRGANIAGLDVGSTFKRTQTRTNGDVSRGFEQDFNVGNLGFGTSLSRDNLQRGFGLQRDPNGAVTLGLGPLAFDLNRNVQKSDTLSQAQVNVEGKNARARANSNTLTNERNFGNVGIRETQSQSNAFGRAQGGRIRRAPARPQSISPPLRQLSRPKRRAQFIPFGYPQQENFDGYGFGFDRPRRQFQNNRRQGFGGFGGGFGYQPYNQNANAQGVANNKGSRFGQQAGTNTHSNNQYNEKGYFQDNGASSIGSNLANDGSSGQVSSANAAQMNSLTADGSSSQNTAQSQSLNFDANQQQATSSNAGTTHTEGLGSERFDANSGSMVTNNNQFGSATNTANTNSAVYENGDTSGALSDASSQSTFQGVNGDTAGALTSSKTESIHGPDGYVSNSASSNASSSSKNGGNANASASSSAGDDGNSANTNAFAGGAGGYPGGFGGANANSGAALGFGGAQGFANGFGGWRQREPAHEFRLRTRDLIWKKFSRPHRPEWHRRQDQDIELNDMQHSRYYNTTVAQQSKGGSGALNASTEPTEQFDLIDENVKQGRTFGFITDLINSLTLGCVYPCTLDAYQQNRCCEVIVPPPPVCCEPPPPPVCCQSPAPMPPPPPPPPPISPPRPMPLPQPRPPPILVPPRYPPIGCCSTCTQYTYYGPPPCTRYGPSNFGIGNFDSGSVLNNVGGGILGTVPRVTLQVPPYYLG